MSTVDLDAIAREWLNQCGPCDYGMPEYGCTHPQGDYRPVMLRLVEEVERLRAGSDVVDAALAYVNAPDGTDEVAQCWFALEAAAGTYQRTTGGEL